jgi:hypothetical protein
MSKENCELAISGQNEDEVCALCERGKLIRRDRQLAFRQWTDKGYVFCRVTVPIGVCTQCGFRCFVDSAESIVEDAVRREYERLP